ncbi:MAG: hypothetical protein V3U89_02355 [Methylophilaceae bacterium]
MLSNVFTTVQKSLKSQDTTQNLDWLDTLSGMTELESLIAVKDQIAQINFLNLKGLKNKIEIVLDLDQDSYRKVKRVTHNYLIKINNKNIKQDTYVVAYEYQRQLYLAYSKIFDAFKAQKKLKLSEDKVNLLLARYLNAAFMMTKWRYFDDQPATFGVWDNVHKVIKIVEELAVLNKNLFLYNFQIKETSIAAILKRGFMVDTLHKGNYSQLEVELTDRVLKIWATNPLIVNTYKENRYHFFIALSNGKGPERLRVKQKFTECRYWRTTRLIDLMEAYLCAVDMQKPLREFGLEKIAPISVVVKLFKKLRVDWCVEGYSRQRRSEERKKKNSLLSISYGIDAIHHRLIDLQEKQRSTRVDDGGFTFELNVATHEIDETVLEKVASVPDSENRWMIEESKSGFAIDFGREVPSWVETGMLVGYSEMGYKKSFNVAEIRSVRKLADGAYRAGFKKISHNVRAIEVSSVEKASMSQPVEGYFLDDGEVKTTYSKGILGMLIDNDATLTPKLLLPREKFKRTSTYNLDVDGDNHEITAGKVVGKHHDWIMFEAVLSD